MSDPLLLPIRPLLHRAIDGLEALYGLANAPRSGRRVRETIDLTSATPLPQELLQLRDSTHRESLEALARFVGHSAVDQKQTTVWFLRNYSPEASILFLLCAVAEVPFGALSTTDLSENQFYRLMSVMARLTVSPLLVAETSTDASFGERLAHAQANRRAEVGLCDWVLSAVELETARKSGLQILALGEIPLVSDLSR